MTPDEARRRFAAGPVARLATADAAGRPHLVPVVFAVVRDTVYSAVDDKPKRVPGRRLARVRHLRRRPEAALTVDRYDDDWSKLAWVQVLGAVRIIDDPSERPGAIAALRAKYEAYGHRSPDGPLLELTPTRALHWRAV